MTKVYTTGDVEVRALAGVSLTIQKGEFVAVMGSSGSGKSTLMNILGCLDRPTAGSYRLASREVSRMSKNELAEVRSQVLGFVFQNFTCSRGRPRWRTWAAAPLPARPPPKAAQARTRRAVGLAKRMDHPNQLSGGQQQRVAIARALVGSPQVILADEPTGNLDSRTSVEVMALFQELGRSGITVALVTHEPDIAEYASRVIVVRDGLVRSDTRQTPRDAVVEEPPSEEVPA